MRKYDWLSAALGILCGSVLFLTVVLSGRLSDVEARTVILVGTRPLEGLALQNITTNGSGVATVAVDTLENPVSLGSIALRNYSGILQQSSDGTTWTAIGGSSGGVTHYALKTVAHTGIMATATTTWGATWEGNLQIAAHVKRDDVDTAEDVLSLFSADYGCHVWQFGFDATNHARLTYATEITGVPGNYTCTTTTITSVATYPADQWVEVAVQKNGTDVYFYKNGVVETAQTGATVRDSEPTLSVTTRLFEGFSGLAASLKVGATMTWPTTGARLIDWNGEMTPGAVWLFPFREGTGTTTTEIVTATNFAIQAGTTWEAISPLAF